MKSKTVNDYRAEIRRLKKLGASQNVRLREANKGLEEVSKELSFLDESLDQAKAEIAFVRKNAEVAIACYGALCKLPWWKRLVFSARYAFTGVPQV